MLQGIIMALLVLSGVTIGFIASIFFFAFITKDNFEKLENKLNEFDEIQVYENSDIRIFKNRKGTISISHKDSSLSLPETMKKHADIIQRYQDNYDV